MKKNMVYIQLFLENNLINDSLFFNLFNIHFNIIQERLFTKKLVFYSFSFFVVLILFAGTRNEIVTDWIITIIFLQVLKPKPSIYFNLILYFIFKIIFFTT